MSIQWLFIAGYLYAEIAVVVLMILPIFSPRRWNQFFKSRLFSVFHYHTAVYFYVLLGVLCLFLMDAVREIRKYSHNTAPTQHVNLGSEMKDQVKLFRAQRNFYITGFAIFLSFVIRRLVNMLIIQDELTQKAARIIKEAESTVKQAKETVLANTLQSSVQDYEELKFKLEEEKAKVKELQDEAEMWKLKYEEAISAVNQGKGDE